MMHYTIHGQLVRAGIKSSKNYMSVPYLLDDDDGEGFFVPAVMCLP
jgi:hypothetical protein